MNASLNFMFGVVLMVVLTDYTVVEEDGKKWLTKAQCPSGTVELPPVDGVKTRCFESCGYLTSVIIPDTVVAIQSQAFFNCSSLKSITLPAHLTEISKDSFYMCSNLVRVTMGVSVSPSKLPSTVKQIHSGTTVIPERFFARCVHLEEIELPESIEEIRDGAFEYCSSLRKISCLGGDIPPKVETIPSRCFYGCSSLQTISIPESVTSIDLLRVQEPVRACILWENYAHRHHSTPEWSNCLCQLQVQASKAVWD